MRTINPDGTASVTGPATPSAASAAANSPIEEIVADLQQMIGSLRCAGTGRMVKAGISMTHLHILWLLEHHGDITMSRLADLLDVSFSNATGLIDRMEERGLVERVRVPEDRRVVLVRASAGGDRVREEIEALKHDQIRSVLGRLDPPQLARMGEAIADLHGALVAEFGMDGPDHTHHH
jgi:DNA-binding MarR family transcriptional regulator